MDRPSLSSPPWAWGLLLAALLVAVLAGVAARQAAAPERLEPFAVLPQDRAHAAEAERIRASDPARARRLTLEALSVAPADAAGWLRLARIETARAGALTPAATEHLRRSFEAGPFDVRVLAPRLAMAYGHWRELPADLRAEARRHLRVAFKRPPLRRHLRAAAEQTAGTPGGMVLGLDLFMAMVEERAIAAARKAEARAAGR